MEVALAALQLVPLSLRWTRRRNLTTSSQKIGSVRAQPSLQGGFYYVVWGSCQDHDSRDKDPSLTAHGQFAASRLGHAVFVESSRAAVLSSLSSFVGALFPLAIAALLPSFRWAAVVAALIVLAGLGAGLARSVHGSWARWSLGLAVGGVLLILAGMHLRIL